MLEQLLDSLVAVFQQHDRIRGQRPPDLPPPVTGRLRNRLCRATAPTRRSRTWCSNSLGRATPRGRSPVWQHAELVGPCLPLVSSGAPMSATSKDMSDGEVTIRRCHARSRALVNICGAWPPEMP
jgi:hypothetical protein